ncbi:hypothetical protein C4561_04600 [candidate division WWE3 bacterium]|jgi:cytochrome b involved in lipid metabolism|uniref:Cytochrome b5 heme-binding domain-containing protein n=1 Tax=candidate division WWE3 bacterium TaxID=2053526 RepID=A0A3A4ZKF2_UNCKA|nr:MAG: hypothetical protein C4561_04600 [candidate division WWE3 bacterium]
MFKITALFGNQIFSSVLLGLLTSATIVTGVGSVAKMSKNIDEFKMQVPEVKALSDLRPEKSEVDTREKSEDNVQARTLTNNEIPTDSSGSNTLLASNGNMQVDSTTLSNDSRCIITLWGKRYDVTKLQSTHSGGNVFDCGTDMTSVYQSQHGTNLSRMVPYLISESSSQQPSNNPVSSGAVQSAQDTRCIVTLWGNQYDVTTLRSSHPGGNIFVCGTDMTSEYQSQHGTNLSMMQKYLLNGSNSPTGSGTISDFDDDENEYEYEDENEEEHEDDEDESKELEEAWEAAKKQAEYERELAKKQAELEHEDEDEDEDED